MSFSIAEIGTLLYNALTRAKKDLVPYDALPLLYNQSVQVALLRPCNGWSVLNQGTTNVTVNGTVVLAPGEFVAVNGNEQEEYVGFLRITFASNAAPGNSALVYQKYFVPKTGRYDKVGM